MSCQKKTLSLKIVICGEIGVGKTCLFSRINNLEFNRNPETTASDYKSKTIEKNEITINCEFWDTAGQEKFYSLNRIFFKEAKIAIIVYDITRRKTYEKIKDFWLNEIKSHCLDLSIIGIAANKSDLYANEEVNEQEARDYAQSVGALFQLCSAFNNEGIHDLVDELIDQFLLSFNNQNSSNEKNCNNTITLDKNKQVKKNKKCC